MACRHREVGQACHPGADPCQQGFAAIEAYLIQKRKPPLSP